VLKTVKGINKLNAVIECHSASSSWPRGELFREELESILGYDSRDPKRGGRPPFDAVLMLKVLVLQKYHGLSDEETEYQIMDRFSFLQFLGLQELKKVDAKSKLIGGYATTPANVHDSQVLEELVDEDDEAVFADSAYQSEASESYLHSKGCQNFIMFKARRGHPLSEEEQATNKLRSRIRVRCEHVFGRMTQMAMDRLRTIGLLRAGQHNGLCNLVYNMDRNAFLCR
jgi:Transposase and inactivated derivatives, IS5 family